MGMLADDPRKALLYFTDVLYLSRESQEEMGGWG